MNTEQIEKLKEDYKRNRTERVDLKLKKGTVLSNEDMLNKPMHLVDCADFVECPIDFKCRNYNPTYVKCVQCPLHEIGGICHKKELHNEKAFDKLITRPKIYIKSKSKDKENEKIK